MKPICFYETYDEGCSYYVFELARILGVSIRTVYRLIRRCKLKRSPCRSTKYNLVELLKITGTNTFSRYVKSLRKQMVKSEREYPYADESLCWYSLLPKSKLDIILVSLENFTMEELPALNEIQVKDAVYSKLLPTIEVKNTIYINPVYLEHYRRTNNGT